MQSSEELGSMLAPVAMAAVFLCCSETKPTCAVRTIDVRRKGKYCMTCCCFCLERLLMFIPALQLLVAVYFVARGSRV